MVQRRLVTRYKGSVKRIVFAGVLIGLVLVMTPGRETQVPTIKIGFVDMTRLFNEYHETKTATANFEKDWNDAQEAINRKADEVRELKEQLQETSDTLSEQQRRNLEERIAEAERDVKDYYDLSLKKLRREEQEIKRKLLEKLQKAVNDIGVSEGYSMIFRESVLLHGAQTFDLTDEILRKVNSEKTGASG